MCGIAGIISKNRNFSSLVGGMNDSLRHRGPDAKGFFIDEENGVYLSHNRLSIIDLSPEANQPIYNEDKSVLAIVNGEIYNFTHLRNELKQRGHQFRSRCDSEVIVHAYEEWQDDFVYKLEGMFAICLWDKKESKLILARDPIGIKPLYFLKTKEIFAFASEIKAFLKLPKELYAPEINQRAAETLLLFPFIPQDDVTMLEGVQKLPSGHRLIAQNGKVAIEKYWELNFDPGHPALSFKEACQNLEEKLLKTVQSHLQSDVGFGVLLSGGVDSSLIAALAAKISKAPVLTLTAGYDHPKDERLYAQIVAGHLNSRHVPLPIDPFEIGQRIEEIVWSFDDLSSVDGGFVTTYLMAEKIRQCGVKVVLSGEGADEVFGGYPWFMLSDFPFTVLPPSLRNTFYYYRISKNFDPKKARQGKTLMRDLMKNFNEKDIFRQISKFEIQYQLPNSFLMKVDKGAMAHGVEVRVPYLDREIVEFAYGLPGNFKRRRPIAGFGRMQNKAILRSVANKYLPKEITHRKKQGFLLPLEQVLKSNEDKVRSYLLRSGSLAQKLLGSKESENLLKLDRPLFPVFSKERENLLWKFFILEVWREKFMKIRQNEGG